MEFFMRRQAIETIEELVRLLDVSQLFDKLEELFEDLDEAEEWLYSSSVDEILDEIGLEADYPEWESESTM